MATHIGCPKCGCSVDRTGHDTSPVYCPLCGSRVDCPKCGAALAQRAEDSFYCPACGDVLSGPVTDLGRTLTQTLGMPADTEPPRQFDVPGFEILGELGRGGMGIVYRARQASLERDVALKRLLPKLAAKREHLVRFQNEAKVAGSLTEAHVLPVFDVLEAHGTPVLVLPYIDGTDLRRIIHDRYCLRHNRQVADPHPWAALSDRDYLARVLPLLDHLVDAVTALHAAHVLHRDIKPSNVLVDRRDNLWLTDFGLSRLEEQRLYTTRGAPLGTHGYSSPEQMAGELELDSRTDLFALGVTLYQTLTLEMPYGKQGARLSDPLPAPPSRRQRLLSRDLDAVVLKALEPDPKDRYPSSTELQDDWRLARQGLLPRARQLGPLRRLTRRVRRNPMGVAIALLLAVVVGLVVVLSRHTGPVPSTARTVRVTTVPPGATVVLVPIDEEPYDYTDGEPLPEQAIRSELTTPLTFDHVPPGTYLVVAELPGYGFHEVYRSVPLRDAKPAGAFAHQMWKLAGDTVELSTIEIPKDSLDKPVERRMVRFKGGEFSMGVDAPLDQPAPAPRHQRTVSTFYLDRTEVTIGDYGEVMERLPPQFARFKTPPPDDHAVSFVTMDEALAYAEKMGKRLPTETEYEFAATVGGTRDFPSGENFALVEGWPIGPVGKPDWDETPTEPPVLGLYSNVAEWTSSMLAPYPGRPLLTATGVELEVFRALTRDGRVVRGGPWPVVIGYPDPEEWSLGSRWRHAVSRTERHVGLGFRCARSDRPRFLVVNSTPAH